MAKVLKDKAAIITGAGRGIGKAYALRFAEEGAKLLLPDISLERAESVAKEIRGKGGEAVAIETDISEESATKKMAKKVVELYGRVDILLNNSAVFYGVDLHPWDAITVEQWDQLFAVNVRGTWLCHKAIAPIMIKQKKGKIINIASSIMNSPAGYQMLHYACSKAAVVTMTQLLAKALGPYGINVNAIGPGFTHSEAAAAQTGSDVSFKQVVGIQAIKRREEPKDLVGTAVFLASKDSDFITGQLLVVDGGTWFR